MGDIHGLLTLVPVQRAIEEISPGIWTCETLFNHWGVTPAGSTDPKENIHLVSGDVLEIFRTAAEGRILWEGAIDLEYERNQHNLPHGVNRQAVFNRWVHGLQSTLEPETWARMFFEHRPAVLTKADGTHVHGHLDPFFETGTEGICWQVQEWGKIGYEGGHLLQKGDSLKVLEYVTDGEPVFTGPLTLVKKFTTVNRGGHLTENFQERPLEIQPLKFMEHCLSHLPVIVSRHG